MWSINPIPRVAIIKMENGDFEQALRKALSLLGPISFKGPITIKPNLCDLIPAQFGVTTDVHAVEALIKIIKEKSDSKISIVESNHWIATAEEEFEKLGYNDMAKKMDVELVNLSKDKKFNISLKGNHFDTLRCPKTLLESRLISISKMKTHHQYRFTGILKNQFGLLPEKYKSKYHPFMSQVLADLNSAFKPFFSVIEGQISMESAGPAEGNPISTNIIICGTDPVAVDTIAARTAGINPAKVGYLKYAAKKGVGEMKDIEVLGDSTQFNFKFIPFPTYIFSRLSLSFLKIGSRLNSFNLKISELLDQAFVAALTVRQGFHTSLTYGSVTKESIYKYAKALLKRRFYKIKKFFLK